MPCLQIGAFLTFFSLKKNHLLAFWPPPEVRVNQPSTVSSLILFWPFSTAGQFLCQTPTSPVRLLLKPPKDSSNHGSGNCLCVNGMRSANLWLKFGGCRGELQAIMCLGKTEQQKKNKQNYISHSPCSWRLSLTQFWIIRCKQKFWDGVFKERSLKWNWQLTNPFCPLHSAFLLAGF